MRTSFSLIAAAGLVLLTGCTVKNTQAPELSGPSEFATGITVQAVPDSILQDGSSQASVVVDAHGPDGRPARALVLRTETFVDGDAVDFGTLSSKTVVTGDDGKARFTYTAPPAPAESTGTGTIVTIRVTPVGGDFRGEIGRQVDIKLVPPGVILPPNGAPVPSFVVTPQPVTTKTPANFDASGTTDEGVPCGARCTYAWSFGDNSSGLGQTIQHEYRTSGSYSVTLTVTDARGQSAQITRNIFVQTVAAPTADFSFSPATPTAGQDIFFTAEKSKAAEGRSIISYDWNFGSGRTATGVTVTKGYNTPGTYIVTLTVTDNAGEKGVTEKTVTVAPVAPGVGPTAVLTFSPQAPTTTTSVFFDGSGSTGKGITTYRFTWGDNSADAVGSSSSATHTFSTAGTYIVRLTVTDADGLNGTTTQSVTVTSPTGGPTAVLTFSPSAPTTSTLVFFDGSASTTTPPATISSYRFIWGDNTPDTVGAAATATHTFANPGTYTVRLTVTDNQARTGTVTKDVTVTTPTPGAGPTANLTASPTTPTIGQTVFFNAGGSVAGASPIATYLFDYGDGTGLGPQAGSTASHSYSSAGTYVARVTVTDTAGRTGTTTLNVTVGSGGNPTAVLSFSPTTPTTATSVVFNGSASSAVAPATISTYLFDFGDGTGFGPSGSSSTSHTYTVAGTYVARLTVTDSSGRTGTTTQNVTVTTPPDGPTARLTSSPSTPTTSTTVNFDASASTAPSPATIVSYLFNFGDGTGVGPQVGSTATHVYAATGTYVARVTVTDSLGRTGTTTVNVTVTGSPTAALTISPTDPAPLQNVFFNASGSTTPAPATIVSYSFDFGDGTGIGPQAGATTSHAYATANTWVARVTIVDSLGRTATTTINVTVK